MENIFRRWQLSVEHDVAQRKDVTDRREVTDKSENELGGKSKRN